MHAHNEKMLNEISYVLASFERHHVDGCALGEVIIQLYYVNDSSAATSFSSS